ncbi:F-box protein at3g12350 [Phtheirospermum japonicum]|uniref:F-box protein at3g12350 n=1 Tax=Phtheirospermum japonicum TaxID=374723 RepID=A0A830C8B5_9LAMI|nr:F-box protein at3g12350 [Phtheirospermum japonicum]
MCHRRWGSQTLINKWGSGRISYRRLYRILDEYKNLIGFWRRCSDSTAPASSSPPPVFFEWGPSYIAGSRVSQSKNKGYEAMIEKPFLWMSVAWNRKAMNYLDSDGKFVLNEEDLIGESGFVENELIRVNVGKNKITYN